MIATDRSHPPVRQQSLAVKTRRVSLIWALAIVVGGIAVAVNAGILLSRRDPPAASTVDPQPTRLEQSRISERERGLEHQRRARERLSSYGWVDRKRNIAHIPIDRAIDILVTRETAGAP